MDKSEELEKVIREGTPRQKAAYYFINYKKKYYYLSEEERSKILESIKPGKEAEQFARWKNIGNAYNTYALKLMTAVTNQYLMGGYKILFLIKQREALVSEENHLNGLYFRLQEKHGEEVARDFLKLCQEIPTPYGNFRESKSHLIEFDPGREDAITEEIKDTLEELELTLTNLRGTCEAIIEFTRKHKSKEFLSSYLEDYLRDAKTKFSDKFQQLPKGSFSDFDTEENAVYIGGGKKIKFPVYEEIPAKDWEPIFKSIYSNLERAAKITV